MIGSSSGGIVRREPEDSRDNFSVLFVPRSSQAMLSDDNGRVAPLLRIPISVHGERGTHASPTGMLAVDRVGPSPTDSP